jgi:hypothetical protein
LISLWPNLGYYDWNEQDGQGDGKEVERYAAWYDAQYEKYLRELFALLDSWKDRNASMELSLRLDGEGQIEHERPPEDEQGEIRHDVWKDMTFDQVWKSGLIAYPPRVTEDSIRDLPTLPYITSFRLYDADDSDHRPSAFFLLLTRFPHVKKVYGGEGGSVLRESPRVVESHRQGIPSSVLYPYTRCSLMTPPRIDQPSLADSRVNGKVQVRDSLYTRVSAQPRNRCFELS